MRTPSALSSAIVSRIARERSLVIAFNSASSLLSGGTMAVNVADTGNVVR
jgi:hypothetical protein